MIILVLVSHKLLPYLSFKTKKSCCMHTLLKRRINKINRVLLFSNMSTWLKLSFSIFSNSNHSSLCCTLVVQQLADSPHCNSSSYCSTVWQPIQPLCTTQTLWQAHLRRVYSHGHSTHVWWPIIVSTRACTVVRKEGNGIPQCTLCHWHNSYICYGTSTHIELTSILNQFYCSLFNNS